MEMYTVLFRFQNWLLPLLFHIVKLLCSDFIAFTHFFYWFLVYGNWCKLGWSDFVFLRFSKMDTLLSIGYIFMSLIPKIGKFLSIKSGQISFIELFSEQKIAFKKYREINDIFAKQKEKKLRRNMELAIYSFFFFVIKFDKSILDCVAS